MSKLFFLILGFYNLFFIEIAFAKKVELLTIPFNEHNVIYSIEQPFECSFTGVSKITTPTFVRDPDDNKIIDTLNYFQQKLNLEINDELITRSHLTFSLTGSSNIYFDFFYDNDTSPCKLQRQISLGDKKIDLEEVQINVEYKKALKSYVLDRIVIRDKNGIQQDLYLYPWSLRGQMSAYEFNLGPAINIHTNIRVNDKNKYNTNNPVVEPIPAFFFRYGPLFLNKNGLGSLLYNNANFSIVGMGLIEGEPYRADGLKDRAKGTFLGAIFKLSDFELTFYNDFFDNKGYTLKLNIAPIYDYRISWRFSPQIFVQYWDNKYMQYYFGVGPTEDPSGKFQGYKPHHDINYGFMLEFTHFVGKWTFVTSTGAKFYGPQTFHSPTVKHQTEGRFIFSFLYKVF